MIKHLLFLMTSLLTLCSFAQSNLIVFAENGEAFSMTVDGSVAENLNDSKVKFEGIKGDFVQVRITFKEDDHLQMKKSVMIEPSSEITLVLKQNKKGAYVLRPMSTVPISSVVTNQPSYPYHVVEEVEVIKEGEPLNDSATAPTEEVVTTTTTTRTTETAPTSISVGIGGAGIKMDVNIDISDPEMMGNDFEISNTSSTTITTTTTTSSSSTRNYTETTIVDEPIEVAQPIVVEEVVCGPMLDSDYNSAKNSINKKSFADDKMILAKQIIKANCVSTNQVIGILELFNFEGDKVEFAKNAYERVSDPQNYYRVNDSFTFSSSIDELNEFLEGK